MPDDRDYVEMQYGLGSSLTAIREAFTAMGRDPASLGTTDLSPVDEFHMRGREATEELAILAKLKPGLRILDVGSGLGGSARYLASHYRCRVTGIDLTRDYVITATELTRGCGLHDSVAFVHGSALSLPFANESFDIVWTEHAQMNIPHKSLLYHEIARVLAPGGCLAFYDVCQGKRATPFYPVPWANDPAGSFLLTAPGLRQTLVDSGLSPSLWQDVSAECLRWFARQRQRTKEQGPSPVGLHLLMGKAARQKSENLIMNLEDKRLVAIQGVARKQ